MVYKRSPTHVVILKHVDDLPSTSQDIIGKKKSRVKFPCRLCRGSHQTHLCPHMDEASKLLEDMTVSRPQLPAAYHKLSLNPPVVDGMITLVPSPVNPVDHAVNLVMSLVEPIDKVVDMIPSSVNPSLPSKSETKAVDLIPSLVDPTLPLESVTHVVDPFTPVDPILPLDNETQVVDRISSSVDPTLLLESKLDASHVFLVDIDSTVSGGIPPSPVECPSSKEAILFNWCVLTGPPLTSHIPFQIIV